MSDYLEKGISRITDQVWIGSAPPRGSKLWEIFDVVVLAAEEYQPPSNYWNNIEIVYAPLDDSGRDITSNEKKIAKITSIFVAQRLMQGKRVLFTCMKGLNRSTFIAALSMLYAGIEKDPDKIIRKMRRARGMWAFTNSEFRDLFRLEALRAKQEYGPYDLDY